MVDASGVKWGRVRRAGSRVLIVATGPSVEGVVIPSNIQATVIAVNGALEWCDPVDYWFSLDPSTYVRSLARDKPVIGCHYYMAVPDDYGTPGARVASHQAPADSGITYLRRVTGDGLRGACESLSDDPTRIHTGNSAYGALGLAYLKGATRIAMLGVDGTREPYAYQRERRPAHRFDEYLPDLFASAVPQLEARGVRVVNGSPGSIVTCFPRMDPSAAIDWLIS